MKANKTITSADIYMSIIFVILFLGVMAIGQLFSSIESLNKITQLNFNQIITWGKIAQRIKFFIGTRENRIESPTLILKIQKDLAELIQKNDGFYRELEHTLEQSKVFFHFRQLDNDNLALITVDPELISRAKEVRDAPLSVFQTNFDYWPISTSNAILSDRYIAKLYQHEEKLSLQLEKQFHTLYLDGIVIISIATLGIILVWLGFLRPTVRKLADAKADIAFILDNAPGYICSYDPQGKFMSANQSYLNFVGVKRVQELLGKHISEFIGIDNWKQIKNHVKRAVNGEPLEFDVEMTMEGKKVVLMVSYRPKLDANGTVTAIVAMIIEITDRYEVERALRLSEENLRTTLNSIGDAVVTTDKYEKIIRMNPQAVRLSGYSEEKATGRSLNQIFKIFNPKTQENTPNLIEIQKKEPELKTSDISHRSGNLLLSSNQQEYQIAESCSTIKNSKGEVIGYVLVFRDVTEEYLLNQKLAHSEKLQSIGQLAGGIAHDFNNILAGIQGSVDLLAHPSFKIPTHEKEKHIKYINRLINRGAGLTEQLTIFARIKELAFKSVNTRDLIQDSLAIVQSTSDRRISFEFIDNTYNPMVFGNDSTLQTAILNIILNAVDAIENTGTIRIVLNNTNDMQLKGTILGELHPAKHYLSITISDTGTGISKKNISRIFDPFYTTKEVGKGTGLGLAATYGTIQNHNGVIAVHSVETQGTTFTLLLPSDKNITIENPVKPTELVQTLKTKNRTATILFADDEKILRETVSSFLNNMGCTVMLAKDGQECIKLFKKHHEKIDILLLDINMPVKSGGDVLKEINQIEHKAKIVISTGYPGEDRYLVKSDNKIVKILEKPYTLNQLAKEFEKILLTS